MEYLENVLGSGEGGRRIPSCEFNNLCQNLGRDCFGACKRYIFSALRWSSCSHAVNAERLGNGEKVCGRREVNPGALATSLQRIKWLWASLIRWLLAMALLATVSGAVYLENFSGLVFFEIRAMPLRRSKQTFPSRITLIKKSVRWRSIHVWLDFINVFCGVWAWREVRFKHMVRFWFGCRVDTDTCIIALVDGNGILVLQLTTPFH